MYKSTDNLDHDAFIIHTHSTLLESSNELAKTSKEHLDRLKSRRIALDERIAASARQLFPDIEPHVESTNSLADNPSLSNQSSFLRLNVGGKQFDISRSVLTQIKGSKLALIFSGKWDEILPRDKDGRIFMDFDASCMAPIIDHFQILANPSETDDDFITEEYPFGIKPLSRYLGLGSLFDSEYLHMTPDHWKKIKGCISCGYNTTRRLIFKGSIHGFTAESFHSMCDGVPETVTIVRDSDFYVIH